MQILYSNLILAYVACPDISDRVYRSSTDGSPTPHVSMFNDLVNKTVYDFQTNHQREKTQTN